NQNYGYGRINADKFLLEVIKYKGVTPLLTSTKNQNVNLDIPDNDATGIDQTFTIADTTPLESVLMTLNIIGNTTPNNAYRGDYEAYPTSPAGTVCRLMYHSGADSGSFPDPSWSFPAWTFLSNAFWGENPSGTWHIRVADVFAGNTGKLASYTFVA